MSTHSPHDALFKAAFSQVEEVVPLLRSRLDPVVTDAIDWTTLALIPGSFVEETLRSRFTDLLFTCALSGREALVFLLVEHQSRSDRWMALRMLRYVMRIWDRYRRDHPDAEALPPVIAVVLHHGERAWSAPQEVLDLVDVDSLVRPKLAESLPKMRFVLDELTASTDAMLEARSLLAFGELSLRALRDLRYAPKPIEIVRRWIPLMKRVLSARNGLQSLRAILEYVYEVADVEQSDMVAVVEALGTGPEELEMVTLGERLRAEGREQGHELGRDVGRAEGRAEIVLRQLEARFGPVSPAARERVSQADETTLERYALRLLTAESIEAALAEP